MGSFDRKLGGELSIATMANVPKELFPFSR